MVLLSQSQAPGGGAYLCLGVLGLPGCQLGNLLAELSSLILKGRKGHLEFTVALRFFFSPLAGLSSNDVEALPCVSVTLARLWHILLPWKPQSSSSRCAALPHV